MELVTRIFENILNNSNNTNSRHNNLNLSRIKTKFSNNSYYLNILYNAGFYQSDNGKRLLFDMKNLCKLQESYIQNIAAKKQNEKDDDNSCKIIDKSSLNHVKSILNNKDIKLLLKLLFNIINNPNNSKYHKLSTAHLSNRFIHSSISLSILIIAGFYKTNDAKYLIFDAKQLDQLQSIYLQLYSITQFPPSNTMKSTYLIKDKCDTIPGPLQTHECLLSECPCLMVIINVLKNNDILDVIGKEYNCVDLSNDFNHLLLDHAHQFENIHDKLIANVYNNNECQLSKCVMMQRNFQNTTDNKDNKDSVMYIDAIDIVLQELFDRIHCYFIHSFDIGYKFTEIEKYNIINQVNDETNINGEHDIIINNINNIIKVKRNCFEKIEGLNRLKNNQKFITKHESKISNHYSYGFRFYYWQYYKNNPGKRENVDKASEFRFICNEKFRFKDWYIEQKYKNLKAELLHNSIYVIGKNLFENTMIKANCHIQTRKAKSIRCWQDKWQNNYGIKNGKQISVNHLICMMIHCNCDVLQGKFAETCRLIDGESIYSLQQRHSNYHHFARGLRECAECFGICMNESTHGEYWQGITSAKKVYHGVNEHFTFPSLESYINGPFSTTTDFAVGSNFCHHKGMVLELDINFEINWKLKHKTIPGFECQWLSDYANEQEIFFIGGLKEFRIKNIIQAPLAKNYAKYIKGLRLVTEFATNGACKGDRFRHQFMEYLNENNDFLVQELSSKGDFCVEKLRSEFDEQMAFRLLSHELWRYKPKHLKAFEFQSCPQYFKNLLHLHCKNIKIVELELESNKAQREMFRTSDLMIDLDVITTVFPHCIRIKHNLSDANKQYITSNMIECMMKSVLTFLETNQQTKLKKISFRFNSGDYLPDLKYYCKKYYSQFQTRVSWDVVSGGFDCSHHFFQSKVEQIMYQISPSLSQIGGGSAELTFYRD